MPLFKKEASDLPRGKNKIHDNSEQTDQTLILWGQKQGNLWKQCRLIAAENHVTVTLYFTYSVFH